MSLWSRFVAAFFTSQRLRYPILHAIAALSLVAIPVVIRLSEHGKPMDPGEYMFLLMCLTPAFFAGVHAWIRARSTRFIHLGIIWLGAAAYEGLTLLNAPGEPVGLVSLAGLWAAIVFDWVSDLRPADGPQALTIGARIEGIVRSMFVSTARTLLVVGAPLALIAPFVGKG